MACKDPLKVSNESEQRGAAERDDQKQRYIYDHVHGDRNNQEPHFSVNVRSKIYI